MRILLVNHNLIWRGSFFRCLGFGRELARRGHETHLWTVAREKTWQGAVETIGGVRVWRTPRWAPPGKHDGGYAPVDILSRLASAAAGRWDIVHAFEHRPNVLLPWLANRAASHVSRQRPAPAFLADWSDWWTGGGIITARRPMAWMDRAEAWVEEKSKLWAHGITVISPELERRALDIGATPARVRRIPAGVAVESFPPLNRAECRKRFNLPPDRPILGFAGFALWDMQLLADAFARVRKRRPDAALLVIGGGVEENAKDIFRRRFELGGDVFLPGVAPFGDIPALLQACDIQLLPMEDNPANRGRLPNKLMDYYASGRPSVVSNVGAAGQLVRENQTGIAAETGPEGLAAGCLELLDNPGEAKRMGATARQLAETVFNYSALTEELLAFYGGILEEVRRPGRP